MNKMTVFRIVFAVALSYVAVYPVGYIRGERAGLAVGQKVGFAEGLGRPQTSVHLGTDPVTAEVCAQEEVGSPVAHHHYSRCIVRDKDGNRRFFSFAGAPVVAGDVISAKNGAGRQVILNGSPVEVY